jgi:hypothetical protein
MAVYSHSGAGGVVEHTAPQSWEGNTIDPRWISPSSSKWSTPSHTPARGRSPAPGMSLVAPTTNPPHSYEVAAGRGGDASAPPRAEGYTGGISGSSQGALMTVQELLRRQSDVGPEAVGSLKPSFAFDTGIMGPQGFPPREHERRLTLVDQGDGDETPPFVPFVPQNIGVGMAGGGASGERSWF